ncbi:hypothetical protein BU17DRAFT_68611 [Hysterangium stoloniferum]|nr:hypothetical protein BU17DRAFT_68611 [Hysterangium stoloniferum]
MFFSIVIATLFASVLAAPAPDTGAKPFTLKNGQHVIALNDKFTFLSTSSACTDGDLACINGQFAQCSGGKFLSTYCAVGTICIGLPLVNKPGTVRLHPFHFLITMNTDTHIPKLSITCNTVADRDARIAATGATRPGQAAPVLGPATAPPPTDNQVSSGDKKSFALSNGKAAQALKCIPARRFIELCIADFSFNKQFASLTTSSSCTAGQNAYSNNQFAQCVDGKFVLTGCAGGLQCAALPLFNSPGTSITCVDNAHAVVRIAATGAGSSLTGN